MKRSQRGVALIFTLILVLVLSISAASLMFLSQSETWSSMNYRLMTQARYGAESGLNAAANYIINTYQAPGTSSDPLTAYNMLVSPVTAGGNPVFLSSLTTQPSNYPVAGVQTAFNTASKGSLVAGNTTVNYSAAAELMSMRQVNSCGILGTAQTWKITSHGDIAGVRNAEVEVSAILEQQLKPCYTYAAFATASGCGSLTFSGGVTTNSYDSGALNGGKPVILQSMGNIGSNGNLNESGSTTTVNGTMSTPRTGVGNCSNGGVDAWTDSGNAKVIGGIVKLPQAVVYNPPPAPNPLPPTTSLNVQKNSTCSGVTGCSGPAGNLIFVPGPYGNINASGGEIIHLTAGTYSINSIVLSGNSQLVIDSGPVVLNIAGIGTDKAIDFSGGSITNSSLNSSNLSILYGGPDKINLSGGSGSAGVVYAPNAPITMSGGSNWYGSIVGQTVVDSGGVALNYDIQLQKQLLVPGNYMLDSFTWSKY